MAVSELVRPKRGSQTQSPRDKKQRKKLVGAELVGSRVKKWFETKYYNGTVTEFDVVPTISRGSIHRFELLGVMGMLRYRRRKLHASSDVLTACIDQPND